MKWEYVALGDLYEVHNGLSKGGRFFGDGFPFLSFSTVFNKWFLPQELPDLVQSTDKEQQSYSIRRGDVFVTRTSETMDELGMSSVALKDYPHATYNGFTKRLRPINSERILPEFIGYYLRTPFFRAGFAAFSTMTTRASLRNEDLLSMKVPVPDIPTQKRIANILSAYDNLIENDQKQIKLLEEAAQRLYKEWFVDLRFPGHENTKITDGVPEGWRRGALADVATFKRGKTITKEQTNPGVVPVVAGGLEPAYFHDTFNTGAPVITVSGSGANAGFTRMYHTKVWASDCSYVDSVATENLAWVYCFLKENNTKIETMQKGAAQPHVYAKDINALEAVIPNDKQMKRFQAIAEPMLARIGTLETQKARLREACNCLLPKLMNGEIEV